MDYILISHSILRWGVLLFGLWAVFSALGGSFSGRSFTGSDKRAGMFFMIFCDLQLILGLILYFKNKWFDVLREFPKETMKNAPVRFFAVEHGIAMILAWLLVHIGYSSIKKAGTDAQKHKRGLIFFGIALLIILAMIPWPFREIGIAREWWPKFS
jgi:undecaprenyl pyrophosphate phosphatase UppP